MHYRLSLLALLSGSALATPAMAETTADGQPERDYLPAEIVVTGDRLDGYSTNDGSSGTKTPTPLLDVPQSIAFITEDQLEDQATRQLGEALRYVAGISLETGEGHRDEIFIRGQETTADFYLDGLRDDAQYYRSLYNIERIEVLKGANALIFGRGGGGGVVNRVTKRARPGETFTSLEAGIDTFGAYSVSADINAGLTDTVGLRLNTIYDQFDNNRAFYDGGFFGFAPTATVALGPQTDLMASYSFDYDRRLVDRGNPADGNRPLTGFDDTLFGDPDFNTSEAEVHIARLRLEHAFSNAVSANASLQYADYNKIYANILPRGLTTLDDDTLGVGFSGYEDAQNRQNLIGQVNLVAQFATGPVGHTLLAGVEAIDQSSFNGRRNAFFDTDDGESSRVSLPLDAGFTFPAISLGNPVRARDSELNVLSAYVQNQFEVGDFLELIAGVRYERFDLATVEGVTGTAASRVDTEVSPRFGVVVKPASRLSVFASYAESFLPQAGDQFFLITPGNAAFAPEQFRNYEIGVKWTPPIAKALLTASAFRLERSSIRAPSIEDPTLTVLAGESRVEGFEVSAVGEVADFWKANLGYTYLDGELLNDNAFGDAGQRLQQLPRHSVSAWNRFDISDSFGLGLGVIHQSNQFASFSNEVVLPSYWRVDAAAFYTVDDRLSIQLNVENLFDEDYYPSAHGDNNIQPGEPLSARIGIRLEL